MRIFFPQRLSPWLALATVGKLLALFRWGHQKSGGASLGNATSRSTPGQMVVDVGGERSIMARRAAELVGTACWDPQLWIYPSPRIT